MLEEGVLTLLMSSWDPQDSLLRLPKKIKRSHRHVVCLASQKQFILLAGNIVYLCEVGAVFCKVLYVVAKCSLLDWGSFCLLYPKKRKKIVGNQKEKGTGTVIKWSNVLLAIRC